MLKKRVRQVSKNSANGEEQSEEGGKRPGWIRMLISLLNKICGPKQDISVTALSLTAKQVI